MSAANGTGPTPPLAELLRAAKGVHDQTAAQASEALRLASVRLDSAAAALREATERLDDRGASHASAEWADQRIAGIAAAVEELQADRADRNRELEQLALATTQQQQQTLAALERIAEALAGAPASADATAAITEAVVAHLRPHLDTIAAAVQAVSEDRVDIMGRSARAVDDAVARLTEGTAQVAETMRTEGALAVQSLDGARAGLDASIDNGRALVDAVHASVEDLTRMAGSAVARSADAAATSAQAAAATQGAAGQATDAAHNVATAVAAARDLIAEFPAAVEAQTHAAATRIEQAANAAATRASETIAEAGRAAAAQLADQTANETARAASNARLEMACEQLREFLAEHAEGLQASREEALADLSALLAGHRDALAAQAQATQTEVAALAERFVGRVQEVTDGVPARIAEAHAAAVAAAQGVVTDAVTQQLRAFEARTDTVGEAVGAAVEEVRQAIRAGGDVVSEIRRSTDQAAALLSARVADVVGLIDRLGTQLHEAAEHAERRSVASADAERSIREDAGRMLTDMGARLDETVEALAAQQREGVAAVTAAAGAVLTQAAQRLTAEAARTQAEAGAVLSGAEAALERGRAELGTTVGAAAATLAAHNRDIEAQQRSILDAMETHALQAQEAVRAADARMAKAVDRAENAERIVQQAMTELRAVMTESAVRAQDAIGRSVELVEARLRATSAENSSSTQVAGRALVEELRDAAATVAAQVARVSDRTDALVSVVNEAAVASAAERHALVEAMRHGLPRRDRRRLGELVAQVFSQAAPTSPDEDTVPIELTPRRPRPARPRPAAAPPPSTSAPAAVPDQLACPVCGFPAKTAAGLRSHRRGHERRGDAESQPRRAS